MTYSPQWLANRYSDSYHVVPVDDLRPHVESGVHCWCRPQVDHGKNGSSLIVHNSADGRELLEEDETAGVGH